MKTLVIPVEPELLAAVERVASTDPRARDEFLRAAIRQAVLNAEYAAMERAYRQQPSEDETPDDWSNPEAFQP